LAASTGGDTLAPERGKNLDRNFVFAIPRQNARKRPIDVDGKKVKEQDLCYGKRWEPNPQA